MADIDPRVRLEEIKARADSMAVGNTANPPMVSIAVGADGIRNISAVLDHDLPAMAAAIEAVLDLHKAHQPPSTYGAWYCTECREDGGYDGALYVQHPCPTVRAITDALGGDRG